MQSDTQADSNNQTDATIVRLTLQLEIASNGRSIRDAAIVGSVVGVDGYVLAQNIIGYSEALAILIAVALIYILSPSPHLGAKLQQTKQTKAGIGGRPSC